MVADLVTARHSHGRSEVTPALVLEGVTKRYGSTVAADSVDLSAAPGELVTLIGPSGCGKSTTLRLVAGLERPDAGHDPDRR